MRISMPHPVDHWEPTEEEDMKVYWQPPPPPPQRFRHDANEYRPLPPPPNGWNDCPRHHQPAPTYPFPPDFIPPGAQPMEPLIQPPPPIHRVRVPTPPPPVVYVHPSHQRQPPPPPTNSHVVYEVRDEDVLCGRGAPSNFHPGNKYFRQLVDKYQSSYIASKRIDKPEIAIHIVNQIRESGGRFLKRTKIQGVGPSGHFCWQDIGEQRAYEKACQALREGAPELRKRMAAKELAKISAIAHEESLDDQEGTGK